MKSIKKIVLPLITCISLTSCLPSFWASDKGPAVDNTGSLNESLEEERLSAKVNVEIANFKTFPDSLLASMNLPASTFSESDRNDIISTLHIGIDNYTEFNQNNMVRLAYKACRAFLANDPFSLDSSDSDYPEKMVTALMRHFMPHIAATSTAYSEVNTEIMKLYSMNAYPDNETTSNLACAFAAANPYTTVADNLCEIDSEGCE